MKRLVSDTTLSEETRARITAIQRQFDERGIASIHFSWNYEQLKKDQPTLEAVAQGMCDILEADLNGQLSEAPPYDDGPHLTYDQLVLAGIIRPNERDLEGEEYTTVRKALSKIMPYKTTNNQRFITEYYKMNGLEYHLTVMDGDPPDVMITEVKSK